MRKIINMFVVINMLLALILFTACKGESRESTPLGKDLTIFISTDIHYLDKDLYDHGGAFERYISNSDGRHIKDIDEIVSAFAYDIVNKNPDILIISGDLTNNGEKKSHLKLADKLHHIENNSDTRIFVIPGNHDIENPWAREFEGEVQRVTDTISHNDFEDIYKDFGYNEAISKDRHSLSYLAAPSDNLWLLMLDTNKYQLNEDFGMPVTNGRIREETLEWVAECSRMAKDKGAEILAVTHHNLLKHSENMYLGYTLDNHEQVLEQFDRLGLNLNLSGHIHAQDIKSYDSGKNTIYDIATGSMAIYPVRYGVLKYSGGKGYDYSTAWVDVEGWARSTGSTDENMLNFHAYSENLYIDSAYKRAYTRLATVDSFTEDEKMEMAKTMGILSAAGFSGDVASVIKDIQNTAGYRLWINAQDDVPMKERVMRMINGNKENHNFLELPVKK